METIRQHKARPLSRNIDLSGVSLQEVMQNYGKLKQDLLDAEGTIKVVPENDALWFYLQQHAMSLIERRLSPEEPVRQYGDFLNRYHSEMQPKTLRMFYYLLLICTRESRHMGGTPGKKKLWAKYPNIRDFHNDYVQDSSADAAVQAIIDNAPDVTLGEYTQFLVDAFIFPTYSGGFGGKAWEEVATPLNEFVQGRISAEIMMDTAFTLAHNNGPIFNKGMLYNNYSPYLNLILDVQRSGQIPQLIASNENDIKKFITPRMVEFIADFSAIESGFGGEVDWGIVKNIKGQVAYKQKIKSNTMVEKWQAKLAEKKKAAAEALKKAKAAAAKKALLAGSLEIMPGLLVPKSKRSQK